MDVATQIYIETVQVSDIPWHRLTTTYGRATDFPTELDVLWNMESIETINAAGEELAQNIEHQSTLWHATPFAMIFLFRIFKKAQEERTQNKVAQYLAEQLVDLFSVIAVSEMVFYWNMLILYRVLRICSTKNIFGLKNTMKTKMFLDMRKKTYSLMIYSLAFITTHCKCFY